MAVVAQLSCFPSCVLSYAVEELCELQYCTQIRTADHTAIMLIRAPAYGILAGSSPDRRALLDG